MGTVAGILKRVKKGEDFAKLAGNFSACPSKARGGELGLLRRGRTVPAFEKAAFALKPGETSEIVGTRYGLHIIQTTERLLSYDKLKEEIRRDLVGKIKQIKNVFDVDNRNSEAVHATPVIREILGR